MKTIVVTRFDSGIADDRFGASVGEFSIAKHFDTLTNPQSLTPLRGMSSHTASTGIGNLIIAHDGLMYGVGINPVDSPNGELWNLLSYGATSWTEFTTKQLSGAAVNYELLVDYPDFGNVQTIIWSSTNKLVASAPSAAGSAATQALTFTTIGQGLVHPKDDILYFPYRTSSASFIGIISPDATPFNTHAFTAFTLPTQTRVYCLTNYGDYLAIPATQLSNGSGVNSSTVYLSNRDTSLTTFDASIPWGNGFLKVLNNLQGALVGISELGSNSIQGNTAQDYNSVLIKVYEGGAEPILIKELKAFHLAGSSTPTVVVNPRVNYIFNNRLYFSVSINPNDGVSPARYGLYSVGKNKLTGRYSVNLERMATNDNSDTGVIAAAMVGDYVEVVHTTEGTLTKTTNGATSSTTFGATSVYESVVNPNMDAYDNILTKNLVSVGVMTRAMPASSQVVMKVRVDSTGSDSDWVTIFTKTPTSPDTQTTVYETPIIPSMGVNDGRNLEFRIESTGGAVVTNFAYKYHIVTGNL